MFIVFRRAKIEFTVSEFEDMLNNHMSIFARIESESLGETKKDELDLSFLDKKGSGEDMSLGDMSLPFLDKEEPKEDTPKEDTFGVCEQRRNEPIKEPHHIGLDDVIAKRAKRSSKKKAAFKVTPVEVKEEKKEEPVKAIKTPKEIPNCNMFLIAFAIKATSHDVYYSIFMTEDEYSQLDYLFSKFGEHPLYSDAPAFAIRDVQSVHGHKDEVKTEITWSELKQIFDAPFVESTGSTFDSYFDRNAICIERCESVLKALCYNLGKSSSVLSLEQETVNDGILRRDREGLLSYIGMRSALRDLLKVSSDTDNLEVAPDPRAIYTTTVNPDEGLVRVTP